MKWIALLVLIVYVTLKAGQLAFFAPAAGYLDEPVGLRERLRAGEPLLLIIAALMTVPPTLAGTWYHRHKFDLLLRKSVECYGLIDAYRGTPEIKRSTRNYTVYESLYSHRWTAFDASRQLGLTAVATERRLHEAKTAFGNERPRQDEKLRSARLSETQRCLHPPEEPPNA